MWKAWALALLAWVASFSLPAQDDSLALKSKEAHEDMDAGRYREAAAIYRQLVAAVPTEPRLRLNFALALLKSAQPGEALPELEKVTHADPKLAPAWFLLGLAYAQLKKPREAIAPLKEAVKLDSNNAQALLELADAELSSGDPEQASRHFTLLSARHPEMPKAWEGRGISYLAISDQALQTMKNQDANNPFWYSLRGRAKASEGDTAGAIQLYREALALNGQIPGLHTVLANLYRETDQTAEAGKEDALEASATKPRCDSPAAACLYAKRDWAGVLTEREKHLTVENSYWASLAAGELAKQSFEQLAKLPASGEAHDVLAQLDAQSGKRLDAVTEWRKALSLDPSNVRLQGRLAKSLFRAREYPEAQSMFEHLVKSEPENPDWQYLLGTTFLRQDQDAQALPYLEQAARREPSSLAVQENLGRVYLKLGQPEKAVACLERARPLDDDGSIAFALSSAYRKLGRADEARAALQRYQQIQGKRESRP